MQISGASKRHTLPVALRFVPFSKTDKDRQKYLISCTYTEYSS